MAFDDEGQRGREQGEQRRPATPARSASPAALEPPPQVERPRRRRATSDERPRRPPRRPAAARSPSRARRAAPARPPARARTSGARRRARSPPARSPARRRRSTSSCRVGPDHEAREPRLRDMAFVPPARHLLRAKDLADARYAEQIDVDDMAARRRPLPRPLQPRVQTRLRRVASRLPADPPPRAGGGAAAHHRPLGLRHLLLGRPAQPRLLHDELRPHLRRSRRPPTATRFPPAADQARDPGLRGPLLRPPATPHVSRRQQPGAVPSIGPTVTSNQGDDR